MAAMHIFGRSLWGAAPRVAAGAGARHCALDFAAAAGDLGLRQKLERKPWVLINDAREDFEKAFGLQTDELLIAFSQWLGSLSGEPAAVGLAHVSGNVYFGPGLRLGSERLSPEQVLVANLYSHGEIGMDAVAMPSLPGAGGAALLRELKTFKRLRWLDSTEDISAKVQRAEVDSRPVGTIVKAAKAGLFKRHPKLLDALPGEEAPGKCLQHPNFGFLEIEGENLEELQASLARNSAARAYAAPDGGALAGCAARTASGRLYAGHAIATRSGDGALPPLQQCLVSMGANGELEQDIETVLWTSAPGLEEGAAAALRARDEALLREIAPRASFTALRPAASDEAKEES